MARPVALVIEDDRDLSTVFAEAVQAAGFAGEIYFNGKEALARLQAEQPAPCLVVLDLHLPDVTGNVILGYIQSQPRYAKVRVIVASADERLAQSLPGSGFTFLLKPISFVKLRDQVLRYLPECQADH